jgi:hypothetical protein
MKRNLLFKSKTGLFLIAVLSLILVTTAKGATRYSVASGNWGFSNIWSATSGGVSGASVPGNNDVVYIEGGNNVTVNSSTATLSSLSISSGSTLTINTSNGAVSAGTIIVNGTIYRSGSASITGSISFNNGSTYEHAQN